MTNIKDVLKRIGNQAQKQCEEYVPVERMEEAVISLADEHTEKIIDRKDQFVFSEKARSQQIRTVTTNQTIKIMTDDEYVQKLGAKLLQNKTYSLPSM